MSVAIKVRDCEPQTLSRSRESQLRADFRKGSIPIVVIHQRRDRLEKIWMAVCTVSFFLFPTPDVVKIPFGIPHHYQSKKPIPTHTPPIPLRDHSRPHCFEQIFFGSVRRLIAEIYSGALRNIHELSRSTWWRCRWSGSVLLTGNEHQRNGKQ